MQTSLLFGIHCHQPVDNFSKVVDNAIEKSYRPFFEKISKFSFKFSVHFSGWLLEYIKNNDKNLFKLMQELSFKGQIEFFTGGFYEPILANIPSRDRVAQIIKLNAFIKFYFKQTPKGLWLTERVWDNSIIKDLVKCNIEYVVVDDYHLSSVGVHKDKLNGYYITEEEGYSLKIFPINKELRYILPFKEATNVCEYLDTLKSSEGKAGIIFDDGEKFGLWPKTYDWVYKQDWLNSFLKEIEKSKSIKPQLFSEYINEQKPLGLVYLSTTSYYEMGEWSLGDRDGILIEEMKDNLSNFNKDDVDRFVKGSIWKNFFVKYPESNRIHKRMLELSKIKKSIKNRVYTDNLFKAQTNDVLWHGVFGGLYLPNLRDNAYRFIINCENIRYKNNQTLEIKDIEFNGFNNIKVLTKELITIFSEKFSGQLIEFDLRDKSFNLQNTLTRHKEAYHEKIKNPKERLKENDGIDSIHDIKIDDLDKYKRLLKYDWYIKNSFIDHISDDSFNIKNFENCDFKEYSDFTNQPFKLINSTNNNLIEFQRDGGIYINNKNNNKNSSTLNKKFKVINNKIDFEINLKSEDYSQNLSYIMEMNLHFASLENLKINSQNIDEYLTLNSNSLIIEDSYLNKKIIFKFEENAEIYIYQVNTISQSESGFDITNQGLCFGFKFKYNKEFLLMGSLEIQ